MYDFIFKFASVEDANIFSDYVNEEELWQHHIPGSTEVVVDSICESTAHELYDWCKMNELSIVM